MTKSNAFGSTFAVFPDAQSQSKNCKRATKPTHKDTTLDRQSTTEKEGRRHNSTYPKGGVSCSKDSFVVNQTLVFQIKFCDKSPALRVAANRFELNLRPNKNKPY